MVAPEQTISRSFDLLPMKSGAVRMAQAAGVPIMPVAGWGTHRFFTKGHGRTGPAGSRWSCATANRWHIGPDEDVHAATERVADGSGRCSTTSSVAIPTAPPPGRGGCRHGSAVAPRPTTT